MRRSLWGLLLVPGLAWAAPMVVHVVRAARGTYRPAFPVFARVHGPLHTTIKAPYDAIMGPLPVAPGSMVAAGAVIARLRPLSLAVTVRALRAEAAAAHTAYAHGAACGNALQEKRRGATGAPRHHNDDNSRITCCHPEPPVPDRQPVAA